MATGARHPDTIPNTRAASVAWAPDGSGFAYTRYPLPGEVPDDELDYWRKVFWHRLGDAVDRDEVVWDDLPDKTAWPNVSLSRDGRWLLVHTSLGWSRVDVHLIDRRTGARTAMIEGLDAVSSFEVVGDEVIGVTTLDADRGRVVSAPTVAAWHDNWCTLVPEGAAVIEAAVATSRSLLVLRSRAAVAELDRYDHDGTDHRTVALPEIGSLTGLSATPTTTWPSCRSPPSPALRPSTGGEPPARPGRDRSGTVLTSSATGAGWPTGPDAERRGTSTVPGASTWSSRCATRRVDGTRSPCS